MFGYILECYSVAEDGESFDWHYTKLHTGDWFVQYQPARVWDEPWRWIESDKNQDDAYFNGLVPSFRDVFLY